MLLNILLPTLFLEWNNFEVLIGFNFPQFPWTWKFLKKVLDVGTCIDSNDFEDIIKKFLKFFPPFFGFNFS